MIFLVRGNKKLKTLFGYIDFEDGTLSCNFHIIRTISRETVVGFIQGVVHKPPYNNTIAGSANASPICPS